jgi:hypothetical protein
MRPNQPKSEVKCKLAIETGTSCESLKTRSDPAQMPLPSAKRGFNLIRDDNLNVRVVTRLIMAHSIMMQPRPELRITDSLRSILFAIFQ